MELNETKLANAIFAKELRPAHDEEIEAVGAVPGYASPVGIKDVMVVVDDLVAESSNLVSGANEAGYHLLNVNYGRDYEADIVTDIVAADEGFGCPKCGKPMVTRRGIEVGNIFKLGTKYSEAMGANFLDQNGKSKPVIMGSYGIGSGRLLQSSVEEHNDDYGIIWPITIAPYHVHLITLRGGEEIAEKLYSDMLEAGLEVLFDDREDTPGVKFNDADLIGIPIRVTVSKRTVDDQAVEVKLRAEKDKKSVPLAEAVDYVAAVKADLEAEIASTVVEVPFKADF
jgi:prolyl-tRNA synthetase